MSRALRNRIDSRLEYHPRDYLDNPTRFGSSNPVNACIPPGGDARSLKIAWAQHQLAARYNALTPHDKMGTSEITKEYEFSEATWSRTLTGQRWAGLTALVALLEATGIWTQHNPQSTTPAKTFNSRNH
jgi:enterochelin esterase-like enzyme